MKFRATGHPYREAEEPRTDSASDEADAAIKEAIARARARRARPRPRSKRWYYAVAAGVVLGVCLAIEPHAVPFVVMCAVIALLCWSTFRIGTSPEPVDEAPDEAPPWREIAASPERLHAWIEDQAHVEEQGWAPSLVARAADRLRRVSATRIDPRVIWIREPTAFAFADGTIYVSRELLSRGLSEAGVAFVLAHEIAHLELGHLRHAPKRIATLDRFGGALALGVLVGAVRSLTSGRRRELEADRRGFDLCLAAGYGTTPAIELFDLLERIALDYRNAPAVFGDERAGFVTRLFTSHPPIRDRRERIEALGR